MVIGKIREKSTLLLIMIGGAMLAFILGDLLNSGSFILNGSPTDIGEIAGNTIDGRNFESKVQETIENYKTQSGQSSIDAATTDQLREQTWNQMVRDLVMTQELAAAGVKVSSDELYDLVQGNNPHPQVVQAFSDPATGQFDQARIINFLKQMEDDEDMKRRWIGFEKDIARLQQNDKYNNLVKKGLYVTKTESDSDFLAKNQRATIKYVVKRYNSVADSTIEVSDGEIKKYYNNNITKYEQDASRDVEFIAFTVDASVEDYEKVQIWADRLKPEFETTQNDTLLVNSESDARFFVRWLAKGELGGEIDSIMFNAEKGYVHGPYIEARTYRLAKLIGIKMAPDSAEARHILIKPETYGSVEKAKNFADSLKEVLANDGDFTRLAIQFSEDQGSGAKGGELGWFKEGQMVPSFNDACFNGNPGDLVVVQSRFGFHIIEVMNQEGSTEKRAVAFIDRTVEPSTKTFQTVYGLADEFARSATSVESFNQQVTDRGLNKRIASNLKENDRTVIGLENPRALVRWAFKSEKGALSEVFEFGNMFVIGIITAVREEGHTEIEEIRAELETAAIKEKKAELFMQEMEAAGAGDIQTIANTLALPVEVKDNIQFSAAAITGLGREQAMLGTIGGMVVGDISRPIKGDQGVYVIYLDSRNEVATPTNRNNATLLNTSLSSRVDYEVFEALKEKAEIEDNRAQFF